MNPASRLIGGWLCALLVLTSAGCAELRTMLLEKKQDDLHAHYESLSNCDKVELVRGYLDGGRRYDPFLESTWPTNGSMLDMLMDLSRKTGVSRNIYISCWMRFAYGSDDGWLDLVEIWRAVLECDNDRVDRNVLLRRCDPLLAEAVDSLMASPLLQWNHGKPPRIRVAQGFVGPTVARSVAESATGRWPVGDTSIREWYFELSPFDGNGSRTCWGLLPDDPDPEYLVYFGLVDRDRLSVKAIPADRQVTGANVYVGLVHGEGAAFLLDRSPGSASIWSGAWQPGTVGERQ